MRAVDRAAALHVCAISFWEIAAHEKSRKIKLPMPLDQYIELVKDIDNCEIIPVNEAVVQRADSLPWAHRDPADRFIVATADILDCYLVTSDRNMRDYYRKSVW
jgi:PIN domain nuclease of toxin-antitoxin system